MAQFEVRFDDSDKEQEGDDFESRQALWLAVNVQRSGVYFCHFCLHLRGHLGHRGGGRGGRGLVTDIDFPPLVRYLIQLRYLAWSDLFVQRCSNMKQGIKKAPHPPF